MGDDSPLNQNLLENVEQAIVDNHPKSNSSNCCSFLKDFKFPIISTLLTLIILIIPISIYREQIYQKYIDAPILEIVNKNVTFVFWIIHCISLVILPFMLKFLFKDQLHIFCYIFPPLMMLINDLHYVMPMKCYCIPSIIEYLISIFLFILLPFKSNYVLHLENFWLGEFTMMLINFISISSSFGASTLSYIIFGRYLRIGKHLIPYPKNPKYAISFIEIFQDDESYLISGVYLSCYSIFTLLSVGHGFLMTFKNSSLMLIPFSILALSTFLTNKIIGIILFCQIFIHLIYLLLLQFNATRDFLYEFGGIFNCLFCCNYDIDEKIFTKNGKKTLVTILFSDILTLITLVLPALGLLLYGNYDKFQWKYFVGGVLILTVGSILHIFTSFKHENVALPIFGSLFIAGSIYLFGFGFNGYVPFIKAYTYEFAFLSWSIILDIFAMKNGYSPIIYRLYRIFNIVSTLVIIEFFEFIGWMEILFGAVQFIVDGFILDYIISKGSAYIGWVMFCAVGMATFCPIPCIALLLLLYFIYKFCCDC